ncbi:MAG: hypothetical protein GC179_22190 [Anaerolineaceae bacterium]|nr:hypothetical protein [Anaerolineaceae bacterium]
MDVFGALSAELHTHELGVAGSRTPHPPDYESITHAQRLAKGHSILWIAGKSGDIGKARLPVPPLLHVKGAGGTRTHTCLHTLELDR